MKKKLQFKKLLLMALMLVGAGTAWADDATATFTVTGLSSVPASFTSSPDLFTMTVAANGGTNPAQNNGSLRLYCKNQMTITSTGTTKIKAVTFNMKINASSGKYPLISAPSGTFNPEVSDNKATTTTWTASSTDGVSSITFTFPANGENVGGNWTFSGVSVAYESNIPSSAVSFANTTPTWDLKEGNSYTQTATTASGYTGTVTYSITSTNSGATIDASTGELTLTKTGSITVQASAEAVGNTFTASTASYTLTVSDTRESAGLSWSASSIDIQKGAESYTLPTLNNPNNLPVTYSITGTENLATEASGVITVNTSIEGTATVKASFNGNETYKPATANLTINVADFNAKGGKYNPYTVAEIIAKAPTSTNVIESGVYVKGYIVGTVATSGSAIGDLINTDISSDTNLAIADDPTDTENYCSVQLPSGSIRTALNAKPSNHPYYVGVTQILVKGDVAKYCGIAGIKNTSEGSVIGQKIMVTSAGLATYCTDVNLKFDGDLEAYIATEDNDAITLTKVVNVPAKTGVLLRANGISADTYFDVNTTTDADAVTGNIFKQGNDAAVASGTGPYNYILNKVDGLVGFYRANNQTVAKNRAYLQTSINAGANGRLLIRFDDETTGISNNNRETITNNRYFDLQGRQMAQPTKGLYIVNGKKVVIK